MKTKIERLTEAAAAMPSKKRRRIRRNLRKFLGLGQHNDPSNPCRGDGYFASQIPDKWLENPEILLPELLER